MLQQGIKRTFSLDTLSVVWGLHPNLPGGSFSQYARYRMFSIYNCDSKSALKTALCLYKACLLLPVRKEPDYKTYTNIPSNSQF